VTAQEPYASRNVFRSFFLGGFECSTHRLRSGKRLDLIQSTRHDELASSDYRLLQRHGMFTARDGFRWPLIETTAGRYDFSSAVQMLQAARDADSQVVWDLWHYGWPDDLDIFSAAFVTRFAAFAAEAVRRISDFTDAPLVSPINEISFFSWAGGEGGIFNPFAHHRGDDVKRQLVRATVEGVDAMRRVNPNVLVFQVDPIINVVPRSAGAQDIADAENYRQSQFVAWDMILGRVEPGLGGRDDLIDVIGVN
jgi:beta-glucosidase/6-phospho-beta-glucosidase/beta-galactosidase